MGLTEIKTSGIADDAVTTDKLANAINTERTANTAKPTLTNNGNNRVATGDGSGGLHCEGNLNFDGNDLTQTITGNGGHSLTSTGNHAIRITANTDRAAENNTLLALRAQWNDTQVAMIDFQAGDDTTNKDNSKIAFYTAPEGTQNQRMLIESNGNVKINNGDLVIGGTGHGINFAASQTNAAGMTSETLDWYEEGTFTLQPADASSGGNASSTSYLGHYIRIGKQVTVFAKMLNIDSTGLTADNDFFIQGMPFTSSNLTNMEFVGAANIYVDSTADSTGYVSDILNNDNFVRFHEQKENTSRDYLECTEIKDATTDIIFSLTYIAA